MRNKSYYKAFISTVLILIITVFCAGCSAGKPAESSPNALAIIIGNHSNSEGINFNNILIKDAVTETIKSRGFLSVICCDGDPDLIAADSYEIPAQYKNANPAKLMADAEKKALALLSELPQVKANDTEVDTLEALRLALRSFSDLPDEMSKTILIIDTGISTIGDLNFRNNLISSDGETIAELLSEKKAIPDFSGVEVIWLQLGDVAAPQEALSAAQKETLISIWEHIITKTGGVFHYSGAIPSANNSNDLPDVSVVDLPIDKPVAFDPVDIEDDAFTEPVFISEQQIGFVPDSSVYLDSSATEAILTPIAEYMTKHNDFKLLIIGTTAGDGDSAWTMELSSMRAQAVKDTLVNKGIALDRIIVKGMGCSDPWHIYGVGTTSNAAQQNRRVVLLDAQSETAKEIIN